MADLSIVDSHVHLWNLSQFSMPWLESLPLLQRPYGLLDYWKSAQELPVSSLVYVEVAVKPAEALREAQWIASLTLQDPRLQAIVAAAPLEQGASVRAYLKTLVAISPAIKGVRRNLQDEPHDFCLQPAFLQGVEMLAEYRLSFDICIHQEQLPGVIEMVRQCPSIAFVLDHLGKPEIKQKHLQPWKRQIETLAALPNVFCKISGMVTEADHTHWEAKQLAPFLQTALEAFGEDRVMFGGDWPVLVLASTYHRWYDTLRELTSSLSSEQQRKLWSENARHFYRLTTSEN